MPEVIYPIFAGSHPVYEVVESEDGRIVINRDAGDHSKQVPMMSGAIPVLIDILRGIRIR